MKKKDERPTKKKERPMKKKERPTVPCEPVDQVETVDWPESTDLLVPLKSPLQDQEPQMTRTHRALGACHQGSETGYAAPY
eukprot:scaffold11319_cov78-Cylindrotheca_fusiformis.AAC.4